MDLHDAFPELGPGQIALLREHGREVCPAAGELLFGAGERDFPLFVVLAGGIRISEASTGEPREVALHGPGHFSGDVDQLTGRPAFVDAHALAGTRLLRIECAEARHLLSSEPELSDTLMRAFQARRRLLEQEADFGVQVLGSGACAEANRLREFLYKNRVPHSYLDVLEDRGARRLSELGLLPADLPATIGRGQVHRKPSLPELAECVGLRDDPGSGIWDLVVVGSGPAGLAAAVYGASEGLSTLVLDAVGPGGQAGSSSRIENYMGFPSGLSGAELANFGYLQAVRFGARFAVPVHVHGFNAVEGGVELATDLAPHIRTRALVIATGASYRQLDVAGRERFQDAGLFQSATSVEARLCRGAVAVVVGGGNSAGQAAIYLASHAERVVLVLRGGDLRRSLSSYLADRIEAHPAIELALFTELERLEGDKRLETAVLRDNRDNSTTELPCAAVFTFIGAEPHSGWLPKEVALDERGFVRTGAPVRAAGWPLERDPCQLETSVPNVFAAGDVRSNSTKRVAFAVGDGALAVTCVHRVLAELH